MLGIFAFVPPKFGEIAEIPHFLKLQVYPDLKYRVECYVLSSDFFDSEIK